MLGYNFWIHSSSNFLPYPHGHFYVCSQVSGRTTGSLGLGINVDNLTENLPGPSRASNTEDDAK